MAEGFRRTMTGRLVARLDEVERGVIAALTNELLGMVAPPESKQADPFAVEMGLEDLDASVDLGQLDLLGDRDPVTQRLFPDAYPDDQGAGLDFRRFTELGLRQQKAANATTVLATLERSGEKVTLTADQAMAWLTTLNDLRLSLSVRLGLVTEQDHEVLASLAEDDPNFASYQIYDFLTWLQESLVQAVSARG